MSLKDLWRALGLPETTPPKPTPTRTYSGPGSCYYGPRDEPWAFHLTLLPNDPSPTLRTKHHCTEHDSLLVGYYVRTTEVLVVGSDDAACAEEYIKWLSLPKKVWGTP